MPEENEQSGLERMAGMPTQPIVLQVRSMMQFFEFAHLPPHLQDVSAPFYDLAESIAETLPNNAEKTTALRKLLEAKGCAVRAVLAK